MHSLLNSPHDNFLIIQKGAYHSPKKVVVIYLQALSKFTDFYRQNSAIWLEQFDYKESGPHLILLAFLQRIVNGGGKIHREYALGRGRVDIVVLWKTQRIVIELKVYKGKNTLLEGLEQTAKYMDTSNATQGHLVIFDKREKSWDEKIYTKQENIGDKVITVWGM
jgi:hypothetical protein